ncbi:hypothetical protein [Pseudogulbenkiania sp. MAI-1]|uniref:hypothetical protein n=1 Tax=Pseudogulbenkiania sp. MAI-1 TaxID=990370 RepID=UPI001E2CF654|nr:hypothetical protein [Pseudogulbenkiania sp. MAI-1]
MQHNIGCFPPTPVRKRIARWENPVYGLFAALQEKFHGAVAVLLAAPSVQPFFSCYNLPTEKFQSLPVGRWRFLLKNCSHYLKSKVLKMKQSLLVAALLAVALSACGKKEEAPAAVEASAPAVEASAPAAEASAPAATAEASAPAAASAAQ